MSEPASRSPVLRYGLLWAVLWSACVAPPPPDGRFRSLGSDADLEPDAGEAVHDQADAGSGIPVLDGTWVLFQEASSCVILSDDAVFESLSHALERVTIEDLGGGAYDLQSTVCWIDLSPVLGMKMNVPEAVVSRIPTKRFQGLAWEQDGYLEFRTSWIVEQWGLHLDDPYHDDLPDLADDPRIYDMDQDGRPGVTLVLGSNFCTVEVVQRGLARYELDSISTAELAGGGDFISEQLVLAASRPFCETPNVTRPNPEHNRFQLLRVDGRSGGLDWDDDLDGEVSCAEMTAHRERFDRRGPDDALCGSAKVSR